MIILPGWWLSALACLLWKYDFWEFPLIQYVCVVDCVCYMHRKKLWFGTCIWEEIHHCSQKWGFANLLVMTTWYVSSFIHHSTMWYSSCIKNHVVWVSFLASQGVYLVAINVGIGVGHEFLHSRWYECNSFYQIKEQAWIWNVGKDAYDRDTCRREGIKLIFRISRPKLI